MSFVKRILYLIPILIFIKLCLCQEEQYTILLNDDINNINPLSFNETLSFGKVFIKFNRKISFISNYLEDTSTDIDDSFRSNSWIPTTINMNAKYLADEEDYTSIESIGFSMLTNQQTSQVITVLAGIANENMSYLFDIEVCSSSN